MLELNKIHHGDCLELMKQMPDNSVDCVITDPPYGINKGKISGDEDFTIIKKMLPECYRILKNDSFFVCFCSIAKIPELLKESPFTYRWMCIMFTNNSMARGSMGFSAFVPALIFMKGNAKIKKQIRDVCEISTSAQQVLAFHHPYQKHDRFLSDLVLSCSKGGDVVLDPFIGGGSTAIACLNTGRDFIGIELEEKYVDIARKRITERQMTLCKQSDQK